MAIFTITMTAIYCITGGIPDTLVTAFFAFAGGEAGVLGIIKIGDTKYSTSELHTDDGSEGEDPADDGGDAVG